MEMTTERKKKNKDTVMMEKELSSQMTTSSSLLKKKKKKHMMIYFAVTYSEKAKKLEKPDFLECYDWYCFDQRRSPAEQYQKLEPITRMVTPFLHRSRLPQVISSISLDSKIYVFKTYVVKTSTPPYPVIYVSIFDTSKNSEWVDVCTSIELKMAPPQLLTCDGKIFILGHNFAREDSTVWGEVFDPLTNALTPLPAPPALLANQNLRLDSSIVIDDHRFFVKFKYQFEMSTFDVHSWSWSSVSIPHVSCGDNLKMVVSRGVVYFFCADKLFVYDLTQVGGLVEVRGLVIPPSSGPISSHFFPVHNGENNFYLIWTPLEHSRAPRASGVSVIHCLNFKVDPMIDYRGQPVWQATIDDCDSYTVYGSFICNLVAMEVYFDLYATFTFLFVIMGLLDW